MQNISGCRHPSFCKPPVRKFFKKKGRREREELFKENKIFALTMLVVVKGPRLYC